MMSNPIINLRWKSNATATDMTEVLLACRAKGWRVVALRGLWMIFTRPLALNPHTGD